VPGIAVLPSDVADQIAAGEVVERPASAVKELIENALDAGATVVAIEVADGGRTSIRVSDDGCGMDRADAMLAIQRHATSKIRRTEDLVGIQSYGFRGEALPAIASVSELTLETATDDGDGTRIEVAGGTVAGVAPVARRRGTTVRVARLFYNVPARLKFMRGARTEWRAIADAVTAIALARREAHVTLSHDGKPMLTLPAAASLRERVGAVWGAPYADSLLDVDDVVAGTRVRGLVERPSDVGTRTRRVYLAVNGRAIRDGGLVRAAEAAYRSTIPAGVRPSVFLDLVLPADAVDVNVHPAKAEVRFRDRWPVERTVESAVRRALGGLASAASLDARVWVPRAAHNGGGAWPRGTDRAAPAGYAGAGEESDPTTEGQGGTDWWAPGRTDGGDQPVESPVSAAALTGAGSPPPELVQLRRTYVTFETEDGIVLVDQHSAHERVLYEQFMRAFDAGDSTPGPRSTGFASQRLLFPLTLHLAPAAAEAFEANVDVLRRLGFDAELFGGHSIVVHGVPAPHPRFDAERCLRETLDALTGDRVPGTAARHERLAATVACKAAIKAGDALAPAEMRALLASLGRTTLPAHDVHGRSTIVRLSWTELERRFGRQ